MKFLFTALLLLASMTSLAQSWKEQIINDAKAIYEPLSITTFNKPLYFRINESSTVGGSAHHETDHLAIILDKGLLITPRLTPDGFRMLICHELGHLFGGAPRKNVPAEWEGPTAEDGLSLLTSEGQADYYASLVCFRKLLEIESSLSPKPDYQRAGARLKQKCETLAGYKKQKLQTCLRTGLAGEDFLKLTFDFSISCEKADDSIAPHLIRDFYPDRQCRLDTIVNGALCSESHLMVLDFDRMEDNGCRQNYATRPACWYP